MVFVHIEWKDQEISGQIWTSLDPSLTEIQRFKNMNSQTEFTKPSWRRKCSGKLYTAQHLWFSMWTLSRVCSPCNNQAATSAGTRPPCAAPSWWWTRRRWWGRTRSCWLRGWTAQSGARCRWSTEMQREAFSRSVSRHAEPGWAELKRSDLARSPDSHPVWCQTALGSNGTPAARTSSAESPGNDELESACCPRWKRTHTRK